MSLRAMSLATDELEAGTATATGDGACRRAVTSVLISMAQAARLLGVSRPTAAAMARARKFRAWLVNARLKTTVEAIEAYLRAVELPGVDSAYCVTLSPAGSARATTASDGPARSRLAELADLQGLK